MKGEHIYQAKQLHEELNNMRSKRRWFQTCENIPLQMPSYFQLGPMGGPNTVESKAYENVRNSIIQYFSVRIAAIENALREIDVEPEKEAP